MSQPSPVEADALVRKELGPKCLPVNLSGYWLIHYRDGSGGAGRLLAQRRNSLPRAIADAKVALAALEGEDR